MTKKDYNSFDYLVIAEESNRKGAIRLVGSDPEHKIHKLLDFAIDNNEF